MTDLYWLAHDEQWRDNLKSACRAADPLDKWRAFVSLANSRIDFLQTNTLDRAVQRSFPAGPPSGLQTRPIRLALLASTTTEHLIPSLRIGALRRGLWMSVHSPPYGQTVSALMDPKDDLHDFRPDVILIAIDARSAIGTSAADANALQDLEQLWELAGATGASLVIQQTLLPVFPLICGSHEFRVESSPATRVERVNAACRRNSVARKVAILDLDQRIVRDGLAAWHDISLWHASKQEIRPSAAPLYGELVGRLLGATFGLSAKVAVLDLDNTLWGGVIGDDGLEGIVIGKGSAVGEAFLDFQRHISLLSRRGVVLAVCSKNDETNARAAFDAHPDMLLRSGDIACFVANWDDKATNIRRIAETLNVGLDSLVFVDDNPFERRLVRRELPMVRVPELPDDPAYFATCIADAGYFEALDLTEEDATRSMAYQTTVQRDALRASATDMDSYLKSLDLRLSWRHFDALGMSRIEQLVNKTNQFNLTARRRTRAELEAIAAEQGSLALQFRLTDALGDSGMISVLIARPVPEMPDALCIDTWLMSCRVLGRQVESAVMNVLFEESARLGVSLLLGEYRETPKNAMVRDHYARLGFERAERTGNVQLWRMDLRSYKPIATHIEVEASQP
jgi:FkbH-like protein